MSSGSTPLVCVGGFKQRITLEVATRVASLAGRTNWDAKADGRRCTAFIQRSASHSTIPRMRSARYCNAPRCAAKSSRLTLRSDTRDWIALASETDCAIAAVGLLLPTLGVL